MVYAAGSVEKAGQSWPTVPGLLAGMAGVLGQDRSYFTCVRCGALQQPCPMPWPVAMDTILTHQKYIFLSATRGVGLCVLVLPKQEKQSFLNHEDGSRMMCCGLSWK